MKSPQCQYEYCNKLEELGCVTSPLKQQAALQIMVCDEPTAPTALQTEQVFPLFQH